MMALGNLCSLGGILERTSYTGKMTEEELEECQMAQWHYLQLCLWFTKTYIIKVEGRLLSPMSIFRRSLAEFMAAVVTEKRKMEDEAPSMPGCSSHVVVKRLEEFLKVEDEDLLVLFDALVKRGHDNLDWSSGAFKIECRNSDDVLVESPNFLDFILNPEAHREGAMVPDPSDGIQGNEDDPMTGGNAGPSTALDADHTDDEDKEGHVVRKVDLEEEENGADGALDKEDESIEDRQGEDPTFKLSKGSKTRQEKLDMLKEKAKVKTALGLAYLQDPITSVNMVDDIMMVDPPHRQKILGWSRVRKSRIITSDSDSEIDLRSSRKKAKLQKEVKELAEETRKASASAVTDATHRFGFVADGSEMDNGKQKAVDWSVGLPDESQYQGLLDIAGEQ
jgi:hypothetical protein